MRVKGSSVLPPWFQKATEARQSAAGASLNKEGPDRPLREAVNVKPGWQRRPQEDIRDARPVRYLPRRAAYREWYRPKKEMYVASNPERAEPSKPFGSQVPEVTHGATGLGVCPAGFRSCLVQYFLTMPLFFPFGMGMYIQFHCTLGVCNLSFDFTGADS